MWPCSSASRTTKESSGVLRSGLTWAATWQNQQSGCAPSEDSDQPGHPPSLIRVLTVHMKKAWILSYPLSAQQRLWSDWADAQADLRLRWAHSPFVGFVTRWLIYWLEASAKLTSVKVPPPAFDPTINPSSASHTWSGPQQVYCALERKRPCTRARVINPNTIRVLMSFSLVLLCYFSPCVLQYLLKFTC